MATIQIRCPNGHLLVIATQDIGKRVQCPQCRIMMTLPSGQRPVPLPRQTQHVRTGVRPRIPQSELEGESEDESASDPGLASVRAGLGLQVAKIYLMLVGGGIFVFLAFIFLINDALGTEEQLALRLIGGALTLVGLTLDVMTFVCILPCPDETEARHLAFGYLAFETLGYLCAGTAQALPLKMTHQTLLLGLGSLVGIGGYLCCAAFLGRMAAFLERPKLESSANMLTLLFGMTTFFDVFLLLGLVLTGDPTAPDAKPDSPALVFLFFGLAGVVIVGIWASVRYVKFIHKLRAAL